MLFLNASANCPLTTSHYPLSYYNVILFLLLFTKINFLKKWIKRRVKEYKKMNLRIRQLESKKKQPIFVGCLMFSRRDGIYFRERYLISYFLFSLRCQFRCIWSMVFFSLPYHYKRNSESIPHWLFLSQFHCSIHISCFCKLVYHRHIQRVLLMFFLPCKHDNLYR